MKISKCDNENQKDKKEKDFKTYYSEAILKNS